MEKTLSLSLRWSVQAIIVSRHFSIEKDSRKQKPMAPEGRIVIYRAYFQRLLKMPMPIRDRLCLELPMFQAFRSGEISTLQAEDIDLESDDIRVLDSKKHVYFTLPLDPRVKTHVLQLDVHEGFLIRGRKHTGKGLTVTQIERIWTYWCRRAGIPTLYPRMGRAYFACQWHFVEHKSMFHLMALLRHNSLQNTEAYLSKLVDYNDLKSEFYLGRMFHNKKEESIGV